jgi:ribonuclease P protein component
VSLCRQAIATKPKSAASRESREAGRATRNADQHISNQRNPKIAVPSSAPAAAASPVASRIASSVAASAPLAGAAEVRVRGHARRTRDWRLHQHADYQRVYGSSRKQFSSLMTYFAATQPPELAGAGPRVGITAGKVLGKAVVRNRIKRRMRAAIVAHLQLLPANVDVVLHPKRTVVDVEWTALAADVRRVFEKIQKTAANESGSAAGCVTNERAGRPESGA